MRDNSETGGSHEPPVSLPSLLECREWEKPTP